MVTVRKIDLGSAFRIGALMSGAMALIVILPLFLCQLSLLPMIQVQEFSGMSGSSSPDFTNSFLQGMSLVTGVLFFLCGIVFYMVVGGIVGALTAVAYNLVARQFGGLQIEVTGVENALPQDYNLRPKAKNSFFDPDFEA